MLPRIFLTLLASTMALASTTLDAQSVCPNEEIIVFGSVYGYTTTVCDKNEKNKCVKKPSSTIVFYQSQISKPGCAKWPKCDNCQEKLPTADPKAKGNFIYGGRQIFLDTSNGISKLDHLSFAMIEGDKSDTHFAIFEISVVYNLDGIKPFFFAVPIAIQLPGDPGIPDPLLAANKTVDGETQLVVSDGDKKKNYKIVESRGNYGVINTKLLRKLDKNPVPPAAKPVAKPTPVKKPVPVRRPKPARSK